MKKRGRFKFKIKTWQLILVLVPLLFLDATLLRLDHIKMTELRDAVLAALGFAKVAVPIGGK